MSDVRRGSKSLLRDINNSRVLQIIQTRAPISRAEIAKTAELPPPTVTDIVNDFLRAGLVRETDIIRPHVDGLSVIGRRPILLALNHEAAFALGVKLRSAALTITIADLGGTSIYETDRTFEDGSPEAVFEVIRHEIREAIQKSGIDASKLLGLGIGMPGLIDHVRGVCRYSSLLGWTEVNVKSALEKHLDIPVYVDNDVNMLAAAEIAYGAGREVKDFLTVTIGEGIGLGIVLHGEIFRGSFGGAGEFGHTKVQSERVCECGALGCLEAVTSDIAIAEQIGEALGRTVGIGEALELARHGNPVARDVFARAGSMLGRSIGNLLNLFNPPLIIVTGEGTTAGPLLLEPMRQALQDAAFGVLDEDTRLVIQEWGDEAWARGAASIVVHEMIKPPIYETDGAGPLADFLDRTSGAGT